MGVQQAWVLGVAHAGIERSPTVQLVKGCQQMCEPVTRLQIAENDLKLETGFPDLQKARVEKDVCRCGFRGMGDQRYALGARIRGGLIGTMRSQKPVN